MRVLVTGGAGFIGSHVVDKLRAHGHVPVIYDLSASPWPEHAQVETVIGQLTDVQALTVALAGCDAVAHLAAVTELNDVHAEPDAAEQLNARGTAAVLEAARLAGVARVLYASTIWVYSGTEEPTVSETTLLPAPARIDTATRLAGELYCRSYQELYGLSYTILRFGIPYGPREREAAVIPAFVSRALAGEPLTLAGDGSQSRRFVYVEDLAEGVVAALGDIARNRVYNLAGDEDVTIGKIAELVQETVGDTQIVYGAAGPGDLGSKAVRSDRAREELGWSASTPIAEGIRRYVAWRCEQEAIAAARDGGGPGGVASQIAWTAVAGEPAEAEEVEACPRKVLIISADIGAGHDLPARAIAREFKQEDPQAFIAVVNGLPAMGSVATAVLRENSAFMFRWVPWLFDLQYRLFMDVPPTRWLASWMLTHFSKRGLSRLIRAHEPDIVVSTYPGTTQVLGAMRRTGELDVPCYASITDIAGLRYWAHPGIDLHFISHPESQAEVERIAGPGSVRWAKPPTAQAMLEPRPRASARAALGLAQEGQVVAVSGGGWGVGDLTGAVQVALETVPQAQILCLCGRNRQLRERVAARFAHEPRVRVMGFTNRMGDVLAAADVLIHSSVGLTVLEALICGCPVISYGFGYGHVRVSNRALEQHGLAQVAKSSAELGPAIERALSAGAAPDTAFVHRPSMAALILGSTRRVKPLPAWRVRVVRTLTTTAATAAVVLTAFLSSVAYGLVSSLGGVAPVTSVPTLKPQVGVIVETSARDAPALAHELWREGIHVTFALRSGSPAATDRLADYGDQLLPQLNGSGLLGWVRTRGELRRLERELGLRGLARGHGRGGRFLYTSSGPSVIQVLLGDSAGGTFVEGRVEITRPGELPRSVHRGEIVQIRISNPQAAWREVTALERDLRRRHLDGVRLDTLLQSSPVSAV
jgi:UDP-glucose 4-epimerase